MADQPQMKWDEDNDKGGWDLENEYQRSPQVHNKHLAHKEQQKKVERKKLLICVVPLIIVILIGISIPVGYEVYQVARMKVRLDNIHVQFDENTFEWMVDGEIINEKNKNLDISKIEIRLEGSTVEIFAKESFAQVSTDVDVRNGDQTKMKSGEVLAFRIFADAKYEVESIILDVEVLAYYDGSLSDKEGIDVEDEYIRIPEI